MGNHVRTKHKKLSYSQRKELKNSSPPVIGGRKSQTSKGGGETRKKNDDDDDDNEANNEGNGGEDIDDDRNEFAEAKQKQRLKEEPLLHERRENELVTKYKNFLKENKILYEKDLFRFKNIEKNIGDVFNALRSKSMPSIEKTREITETNFHFLGVDNFQDRRRYLNNLLEWSKLTTLAPNTLIIKIDDFTKFVRQMIYLKEIPKRKRATLIDFLSKEIPTFKHRVMNSKAAYLQRKNKKDATKMIFAEDIEKVITHKFFTLGFQNLVNGNLRSKTFTPAILRNIVIFLLLGASSGRAGVICNLTMEEYYNIEKIERISNPKNHNEKEEEDEIARSGTFSTTTNTTNSTASTSPSSTSTASIASTAAKNTRENLGIMNDENQNLYVLNCQRHKTQKMYGDAQIILTHPCKMALDSYVSFIRPSFVEEAKLESQRAAAMMDDDDVEEKEADDKTPKKTNVIDPFKLLFLNSQGRPFTTQALNNAMNSLTKTCDLDKKFTSTTNRKGTTTETAIAQPQLRRNVARFMYHHENTAEKYYNATLSTVSLANTFVQTKKGNLILKFSYHFKKDDDDNDDIEETDDDGREKNEPGKRKEEDYVEDKDEVEEGDVVVEDDDVVVEDDDVDYDDNNNSSYDNVDEDNNDNEDNEGQKVDRAKKENKSKNVEELDEHEELKIVDEDQISSTNTDSPTGKRKRNDECEILKKNVHFRSPDKLPLQLVSPPEPRTKYLQSELSLQREFSASETIEHISCTPSFSIFEQNLQRQKQEILKKNEEGETSKTSQQNLQIPFASTPNSSYCDTPVLVPLHFLEAVEDEYDEQQKIDDNAEENRGMLVSTRKKMKKNLEEISNFQPLEADTPTRILMDIRKKTDRGKRMLFNPDERKYLFSVFREEIDRGEEEIPANRIREKLSTDTITFYCKELNYNEGVVVNRIRSTIRSHIMSLNKKKMFKK